jgi:hypothetical protein
VKNSTVVDKKSGSLFIAGILLFYLSDIPAGTTILPSNLVFQSLTINITTNSTALVGDNQI